MNKVSFYLIEKKIARQVDVACRLCQQLYGKHRIWVFFSTSDTCEAFDQLLWQYDPHRFIPHGVDQLHAPICLSLEPPKIGFDLCINFTGKAINITNLNHSDIHIIEIVGHNEEDKALLRDVYMQYRQWGVEPVVHKI